MVNLRMGMESKCQTGYWLLVAGYWSLSLIVIVTPLAPRTPYPAPRTQHLTPFQYLNPGSNDNVLITFRFIIFIRFAALMKQ